MKLRLIILLLGSICTIPIVSAEESFRLAKLANQFEYRTEQNVIKMDTTFKPFILNVPISGLGISGRINKSSSDYVVRVILKDKSGNEFLILESYEELNNNETIRFTHYGEETLLLKNTIPDSIKVFVKDAYLQIDSFIFNEALRDTTNYMKNKEIIRTGQINSIIARINAYNRENQRPWIAGKTKLSKLPYAKKKELMGASDNISSGGFEYYVGGFFVVGHNVTQPNRSLGDDPFVDSFDWRNRHGKNWNTSVKDQGVTQYCVAFAAIGCVEALARLYFNNADWDLDLSEQEIVSCADSVPHMPSSGFTHKCVLDYIHENGVCDEIAYPIDNEVYNPYYQLTCNSGTIMPNELIRTESAETTIAPFLQDIKRALIAHGPLLSGWQHSLSSGHAMALVGYGKIKSTDSISYYNPLTNTTMMMYPVSTKYVGSTYWIFKKSNGDYSSHNGYYYLIFDKMIGNNGNVYINNMAPTSYFGLPISSLNYDDGDIIIEDADGDGFYNWGIGTKPQTCPSWIPDSRDGDDSDPTKGGVNEYGHLINISNLIREPALLQVDALFNYPNSILYNDIIIPAGRTLTISGSIMSIGNTSITVESGGTLIVDGGIWANAKINLSSSSHVRVINNGIIYMRKGQDFLAPAGCIVEIENGEISKPYVWKSSNWTNP